MVLGQVRLVRQTFGFCSDVTESSDALLATQSINEDSVTWCQDRLVRQMFGLNSVHAHLHGVVFGQVRLVCLMFGSILFRMASLTFAKRWWQLKRRSVTWCQVRLVCQMFELNSVHAHLHGVVFGQVRLVRQMFGGILFRLASLTFATCWWQLKHNERSVTWCQVRSG